MPKAARLIAFYLPQYHPIPENDEWWGKGFTEWTNTAKAQPLFPGHYQPHVPADLGFYDLRLAESRVAQAEMAKQYGLEGFCYYHYWFGGKKLLERPLEEVLQSGKPDFGFCMCWANQTWTGVWHGAPGRILIEQTYPGDEDHRNHFEYLLPAFQDERHIRVDGKPVFVIYSPMEIPDVKRTMDLWREMAVAAGLKGLHLVAAVSSDWVPQEHGFDASITSRLPKLRGSVSAGSPVKWLLNQYRKKRGWPSIYSYEKILSVLLDKEKQGIENYNCVIPNWDNTPRSGENGLVFQGSTPAVLLIDSKGVSRQPVTPDAAGAFVFTDLQPGTYSLEVDIENFFPLTRANLVVAPGGTIDLGVLKPRRPEAEGTVTGKVTLEKGGPARGAEVAVSLERAGLPGVSRG